MSISENGQCRFSPRVPVALQAQHSIFNAPSTGHGRLRLFSRRPAVALHAKLSNFNIPSSVGSGPCRLSRRLTVLYVRLPVTDIMYHESACDDQRRIGCGDHVSRSIDQTQQRQVRHIWEFVILSHRAPAGLDQRRDSSSECVKICIAAEGRSMAILIAQCCGIGRAKRPRRGVG